ncbi:MAG: transglycosylase family protein [Acidimicrobiales bacterium]
MRPHPKLAITSATVILGAAGAIGVAHSSGPSTPLVRAARHSEHPRLTARVRQALPRLPRAATAIVAGVYRTTPLPYLFAHRQHEVRPAAVASVTVAVSPSSAATPSQWLALRLCESDDNYIEDTGNGYYGAYQFAASTWWGLGFSGLPSDASVAIQNAAAARLQRLDGWSAWPACSTAVGL